MIDFADAAPRLGKVINHICAKSPFQRKSVERTFGSADARYLQFADGLVVRILESARALKDMRDDGDEKGYEYLADAYLAYTKTIRIEEMHFAREGKYRMSSFDEVNKAVYSQADYMIEYVVGLGLTQIFWPNHYQIVRFYLDRFTPRLAEFEKGAEVGVGHGLFLAEMLRAAPKMTSVSLDISPTSLKMTELMIGATGLDPGRAEPRLCDIQKEIPLEDGILDALLMGELIEHIEDGEAVLGGFTRKMAPGGCCFFTTAANAPAEDHILLFRTTGEIRGVIERAGWAIEEEHLGTLNDMSVEEAEEGGHCINYAAVLTVH